MTDVIGHKWDMRCRPLGLGEEGWDGHQKPVGERLAGLLRRLALSSLQWEPVFKLRSDVITF